MPTISIFYGICIQMFWNEHMPPHFHALYAGYKMSVDLKTLGVIIKAACQIEHQYWC